MLRFPTSTSITSPKLEAVNVSSSEAIRVLNGLKSLLNGDFEDVMAFYNIVYKIINKNYEIPSVYIKRLQPAKIIRAEHRSLDPCTFQILRSAIEGNGLNVKIVSPLRDRNISNFISVSQTDTLGAFPALFRSSLKCESIELRSKEAELLSKIDNYCTEKIKPLILEPPLVDEYKINGNSVFVVRDDKLPTFGQKSRLMTSLFSYNDHLVYPALGSTLLAVASCAKLMEKKATVIIGQKEYNSKLARFAKDIGEQFVDFNPVILPSDHENKVDLLMQKAGDFAKTSGGTDITPGIRVTIPGTKKSIHDEAMRLAASTVDKIYGPFDEVWAAATTGTLIQGISKGIRARFVTVHVIENKYLLDRVRESTRVINYDLPFGQTARIKTPFPSEPNFDAKAWEELMKHLELTAGGSKKKILFWNVTTDNHSYGSLTSD